MANQPTINPYITGNTRIRQLSLLYDSVTSPGPKFISKYCCIRCIITNLHVECTIAQLQMLHYARFCQFDGAQFWIVLLIVSAISLEITWYFLQYDARKFMCSVGKLLSFRNDICMFLIFESQKTNRTKILRQLWCERLPIRVESIKGEWGTFTYPSAFFLPLVFENSNQGFIEYSTVTFDFDFLIDRTQSKQQLS